jgi:hypothetical protein
VFSTSSFDGQVGVHNLHACTSGKVAETVNPDFSVTQHEIGREGMAAENGRAFKTVAGTALRLRTRRLVEKAAQTRFEGEACII